MTATAQIIDFKKEKKARVKVVKLREPLDFSKFRKLLEDVKKK